MQKIFHPTHKERTLFLIGILVLSGVAAIYVVKDYMGLIALSLIFALMVHPLFVFFKIRCRFNSTFATLLTLCIAFALIILPVLFVVQILLQELHRIGTEIALDKQTTAGTIQQIVTVANRMLTQLPFIQIRLTHQHVTQAIENVKMNIDTYFFDTLLFIGGTSIKYLAQLFIFLILTYFLIPSLSKIKAFLLSISPFHDNIDELYVNRSLSLILSLLKTVFVIAFAQGILGGMFLWIAGIPYILTFTILLIFTSLIPFIGTNIIVLPIAVWQLMQGNYASASIILFGQLIFVTNIDNILAAAIISRNTSLHPALMLISLVGGISVFGLSGILFGPIIMILFITTLEVYQKHIQV